MLPAREILLADADVLIDYAVSDMSILQLASRHIGQLYVLAETLATVRQLSVRDCRRHGIQVIQTETDVLLEAGTLAGALSFEDWLCFVMCRNNSWTCLTNDRALIWTCRQHKVLWRRGLGLMIDLVRNGAIPETRALQVAQVMHSHNPQHINERVLIAFRRAIRE